MATYCFTDLHGQYDLWQQIKEYIKPDDTIFCLGDCIDRGDAGLKILFEVLNTPNITLLCGNHEDFIIQVGKECVDEEFSHQDSLIWLWLKNGGEKSIEDFEKLSIEEKKNLIEIIKKLPTHIEYTNTKGDVIYLCHAGRQPQTAERLVPDHHLFLNNYIWDRKHIYQLGWNGKDNEYCVHGHTPIYSLQYYFFSAGIPAPENKFEIFKYCEGHKIDIDLCSYDTHKACLFNLDTFEPIYFTDRSIING